MTGIYNTIQGQCHGRVKRDKNDWGDYRCEHKGRHKHDGKWYCKKHLKNAKDQTNEAKKDI